MKNYWIPLLKKNILLIFAIFISSYNIFQSSYHLFYGDLLFHTDIARDFMLTQGMIDDGKFTLIGPRAGGIPGVFYSPLWFYVNAPVLFLAKGNPVVVGYYWLLLAVGSLGLIYWITKKVFGNESAYIAAIIYSFQMIGFVRGMTPWFGSVLLSPLLLYLMFLFVTTKKLRYYSLGVLINGFIICFQPAFGLITLFITYLIGFYYLLKNKKITYLTAYPLSVLPLFTYFLFEVRHNFLQTRAIIDFLFQGDSRFQIGMLLFMLRNRIDQFLGRVNVIGDSNILSNLIFLIIFILPLLVLKKAPLKKPYHLFFLLFYLYFGLFWVITFLFKGIVWDYYHLGFLPLLIIIFAALNKIINKKLFVLVCVWVIFSLFLRTWNSGPQWISSFTNKNSSSWKLNGDVAKFVYRNATRDFGYFVYSPDEFGYSIKYAVNYVGRESGDKGAICVKRKTTFLLYDPYKKSPNEYIYWKNKRVNIKKNPVFAKQIGQILVEKYELDPHEETEAADPNLVCGLHFR